ncbi:MAG: EAL domain-containing protein [Gammaproteobacteria bacterium]|nr:EAL domain-containing protein [Gammaproteobacteria bacterium]
MLNSNLNSKKTEILVIDDDQDICMFVRTFLECVDYTVIDAASGTEALVLLEKINPDLILLDVHLPDISGIDLLTDLSGNNRLKDIPVIMMTGDSSKETIDAVYELNVYDFIEKPVNEVLLLKRVEYALLKKHAQKDLLNKEKSLSRMQHIAGIGSWEYDSELDNVECSEALFELLGIENNTENFSLHSFLAMTHEEDIDLVSNTIYESISKGISYAMEHRVYDDSGNETIVLHQGEIIKNNDTGHYKIYATLTDITERKNTQELIEYNSFYDKLTDLPNRVHYCNKVSTLMQETDKEEKLLAIVFLGIDRFKNINESLGHSIGDELLIEIKERLITFEELFISRFSGDVFAVAIPSMTTIDTIVYEVRKFNAMLSKPFIISGHELYITVSIGISIYPLHYGGKDDLINNAESAMHYSKNAGGNRISCFDKQMTVTGRKRLFIENDLRKAIDKEQFEVYYQPQVAVANRRLIGMEALIRWNHPEHGLINPDDFIPIAEETGLIVPIGQWVIETATQQVAQWIKNGFGLLRVGINLSAMQFENTSLVKDIENALSRSGLMPCSLDLEVTESSVMRNIDQTISILNAFSEMGVQTSMDDFGTGYSSLSSLKMMPLHTLKIDRAFVKDIKANGENGELARIIISMCHALGLNVIAEGVETEEHMSFLNEHGCIEAQGYFFSPPVNSSRFEEILNQFSSANVDYGKPESDLLLFS